MRDEVRGVRDEVREVRDEVREECEGENRLQNKSQKDAHVPTQLMQNNLPFASQHRDT